MKEPPVHATATAVLTVGPADLASALPLEVGDALPAVFATARMVALVEVAAARLLRPCPEAGELSVGVSMEVTHSAPTPPGATVTATACLRSGARANCSSPRPSACRWWPRRNHLPRNR